MRVDIHLSKNFWLINKHLFFSVDPKLQKKTTPNPTLNNMSKAKAKEGQQAVAEEEEIGGPLPLSKLAVIIILFKIKKSKHILKYYGRVLVALLKVIAKN